MEGYVSDSICSVYYIEAYIASSVCSILYHVKEYASRSVYVLITYVRICYHVCCGSGAMRIHCTCMFG